MKKLLFAALAALLSFAAQAQEFDSVRVDTTSFPGPTYVRIKFPHDGFRFTRYIQRDYVNYPPLTVMSFWFKECTGTLGTTYYDTTFAQYVYANSKISINLILDDNAWDTTCVLRPSYVIADTVWIDYSAASTNVNDKEIGYFSFYPNPTINHRLTIEMDTNRNKTATATFYNLQGGKVATYTLNEAKTEIVLPPHLTAGNYLLLLQTADGSVERKLITVQ